MPEDRSLVERLREVVHPLGGGLEDYDPLLERTGGCRLVLIGEASHGTHEFYRERADITKRLIARRASRRSPSRPTGRTPTASNRYVRGGGDDADGVEALGGLRALSRRGCGATPTCSTSWAGCGPTTTRSARPSAEGRLLRPRPVQPARLDGGGDRLPGQGRSRGGRGGRAQRYACFDHFGERPPGLRLRRRARPRAVLRGRGGRAARRAAALGRRVRAARRPARRGRLLLRRAERAARARTPRSTTARCSAARCPSWNLRDRHMAETLEALRRSPLGRRTSPRRSWSGRTTRISATRARPRWAPRGEWNVGQLVRERHGRRRRPGRLHDARRDRDRGLGLGRAGRAQARAPGAAGQLRGTVPRGRACRASTCRSARTTRVAALRKPRLERAIGVIYRPETERASHYFHACLPASSTPCSTSISTRAVEPLGATREWERGEVPETFPSGV